MNENKWSLAGHLGNDPVLGTTKSGNKWTSISIGVSVKKGKPGDKPTYETEWYKALLFGDDAVAATTMLSKGDNVLATGRPNISQYTNREGETQVELSMMANKVLKIAEVRIKKEQSSPQQQTGKIVLKQNNPRQEQQASQPVARPEPAKIEPSVEENETAFDPNDDSLPF